MVSIEEDRWLVRIVCTDGDRRTRVDKLPADPEPPPRRGKLVDGIGPWVWEGRTPRLHYKCSRCGSRCEAPLSRYLPVLAELHRVGAQTIELRALAAIVRVSSHIGSAPPSAVE